MQDPERPKQGSQSSLVALEAASAASEVQRSSGGSRQKPEERVTLEDGLGSLYACLRLSSKHFCLATTLALSAILFILLALFGPDAVQRAMDEGIHRAIIWAPDSPEDVDIRYRGVCDPHDPRALLSHVVLYMYNITNVDAIRAEGAKPHVELVGPYRYLKVTCRLDVWWDSDGRVSSKEYTHYVEPFEGRQPGDADPDASITTLNLALGSVVEAIHANVGPQTSEWLDLLVSVLAGWQDPRVDGMFVHRTARDLLWGYEDQLLLRLKSLLPPGKVPRTRVQLVENVTGPEEARTRPASLFETGAHNLLDIWTILKDRNVSKVTAWPGGEACIEPVRGSDGMQFRPNLKIHDRLQLWLSTLYRSTELVSTGATFFHGIRVLRYWPDVSIFAPNPCKSQRIPGLLNITSPLAVGAGGNGSAAAGAPVYVSRPHFCGCDGSLRQGVTGLPGCAEVDPQLAWLDVEPITGITMRAFQSSMVSSEVTLAMREHLEPRVYSSPIIPIFNSHETVEATEDAAKEFVARVYGARRLKAHLHLWPLLLATACASACACVLVHASVTHLKQAQQAEANETEAGRQARQLIIDRVTSQTAARARAAVRENDEMLAARGDLAAAGEIQGVGLDDSLAQPLLAPGDAAD